VCLSRPGRNSGSSATERLSGFGLSSLGPPAISASPLHRPRDLGRELRLQNRLHLQLAVAFVPLAVEGPLRLCGRRRRGDAARFLCLKCVSVDRSGERRTVQRSREIALLVEVDSFL
jgi:hypothetical protein